MVHLYLILLFLFCYGLSTLHNGIYWDDYTLINVPTKAIIDNFYECGRPQLGFLHSFYLNTKSPILFYKLSSLIFRYLSLLFIFLFLKNLKFFKKSEPLLIFLLLIIIPINQAYDSLVLMQYQLSLALLFLGCYLWIKSFFAKNRKLFPLFRVLIHPIIFLSFTIESSAALFSVIIPITLAITSSSIRDFFKAALKNIDYLIIPFLFIAIEHLYFKPHGACAGNNKIDISNLSLVPLSLAYSFISPLLHFPIHVFRRLDSFILLIPGIVFSTVFIFLRKRFEPRSDLSGQNTKVFLLISVILLFVGIFPYAIVGKMPKTYGWFSRFQSHSLLGLSFLIFLIYIKIHSVKLLYKILPYLTIFVFTTTNFGSRLIYTRDYLKQEALKEIFKSNETINLNQRFFINDEAYDFNAFDRIYRFYEFTGIFSEIFAREDKIAYSDRSSILNIKSIIHSTYPELYRIKDLPINFESLPEKKLTLKIVKDYPLSVALYGLFSDNNKNIIRMEQSLRLLDTDEN